jgi:hypothetical protein
MCTLRSNHLDKDEFALRCRCGKRIAFQTVSDIGSREFVISQGWWCRRAKGLLCGCRSSPTDVTVDMFCTVKCAGLHAVEFNHVQEPHVTSISGTGMPFQFTDTTFCKPGCRGGCVEAEWQARKKYESSM